MGGVFSTIENNNIYNIWTKRQWGGAEINHGFPFIIYGLFCVLAIIFVWKYVPETKNKSLEAIQNLWKAK
tara:strand:- start:26131 stop:26340 length:210 start_codon:yes stop_codon:yes gene_type:complete